MTEDVLARIDHVAQMAQDLLEKWQEAVEVMQATMLAPLPAGAVPMDATPMTGALIKLRTDCRQARSLSGQEMAQRLRESADLLVSNWVGENFVVLALTVRQLADEIQRSESE